MFVQILMLALTERRLGTCLEVSVTGYSDILKKEFRLPENQHILCGIAIGYPAEHNKVNDLIMSREDVDRQVTFLND